MCLSLVSMLDFMGQNLTPLKSRLSKLQSWHQNFSCLVGPHEHFYTRCLLSARTSHGTTFAPRLKALGRRGGGEAGGRLLNKALLGEASPRGPVPYPYIYYF